MTLNHSYQKELETLILDTLLPTYIQHKKGLGIREPLQGINPELLKQIKQAKKLPALFLPKEN